MDANSVVEVKNPLEFHSCVTPRGLLWYDPGILTAFQQKQLNEIKTETIKEDCKYLAAHPEVRAIIGIFVREVFRKLPLTVTMAQFARNFFSKKKPVLEELIINYMKNIGEPVKREGDSAVNIETDDERRFEQDMIDNYFQPPYYCYLAYKDELSEEIDEEEEEEEEELTYGTVTDTDFTTTEDTASKYSEFIKRYSEVRSSRTTGTEPNLLRVTPAGSQIDAFFDTYEMDDMDILQATLALTQEAIGEESHEDSK